MPLCSWRGENAGCYLWYLVRFRQVPGTSRPGSPLGSLVTLLTGVAPLSTRNSDKCCPHGSKRNLFRTTLALCLPWRQRNQKAEIACTKFLGILSVIDLKLREFSGESHDDEFISVTHVSACSWSVPCWALVYESGRCGLCTDSRSQPQPLRALGDEQPPRLPRHTLAWAHRASSAAWFCGSRSLSPPVHSDEPEGPVPGRGFCERAHCQIGQLPTELNSGTDAKISNSVPLGELCVADKLDQ